MTNQHIFASKASKLPSDVRKPKCCSCNGLNARCKLCICVKSGRSCQSMKRGVCVNSIQSAALSSTNSASTESTNSTCSQPLIPSCICPEALPVTSHSQPAAADAGFRRGGGGGGGGGARLWAGPQTQTARGYGGTL